MPTPTKALAIPASDGETLSAATVNHLDSGQYDRIARSGTTPLTGHTTVDTGAYTLTLTSTGAGAIMVDGDKSGFIGTAFPAAIRALSGVVLPVHVHYDKTTSPVAWAESPAERIQQVDDTGTVAVQFWFSLPVGALLRGVQVGLKKAGGAASLPGTLPTLSVWRHDLAADTVHEVAAAVADTSADLAAYKLYHRLQRTVADHVILADNSYFATLTGDNDSSGAADGLYVYRPSFEVGIMTLRPV